MKILVDKMPPKVANCLFSERRRGVERYCMITNKLCDDVTECECLKVDYLKKEFHIPKDFNAFKNETIKLIPCSCGSNDNYGYIMGNPSLYSFRCNSCGYETEHFPTVKEAADYWNWEHRTEKAMNEGDMDIYTPYHYQVAAKSTADTSLSQEKALVEGLVGMNSEAGEALDIWKKYEFHKHDLDKKAIALELGDVLWYLTEAAVALGYSLEDIMKMNIEKLTLRYPDGFDPERSKNRED